MSSIPPTIQEYIDASNAQDGARQAACFAPDGVVEDEHKTHRGIAEIQAWAEETHKAYNFSLAVKEIAESGPEVVVIFTVTGNFDGSPIDLRHIFTLSEGKIAALAVRD